VAAKSKMSAKDKDEVRRAKLKKAALLRAVFNAQVALDRIDHKLDVIDPAMKEIESAPSHGELHEITGVVVDEDA